MTVALPVVLEPIGRPEHVLRGNLPVRREPPPRDRARRRTLALAAAALALATAVAAPWVAAGPWHDLVTSLRSAVAATRANGWQVLPALLVLAALSGVHFTLAAVALRASAGRSLRLREVTLVQLAAAAANRVTPSGLGGVAVNARYLAKRGVPPAAGLASLGALGALGMIADTVLLLLLLWVAPLVGVHGGQHELAALVTRAGELTDRLAAVPVPALVLAGLGAAAALAGLVWWRRRRGGGRWAATVRTALTQVGSLARRPRTLVVLMLASAGTTVAMAAALAASLACVTGVASLPQLGSVLMAYLAGAAASSVTPMPAGIGSTEAALAAALVVAGVGATDALAAALLFRAVTFWAPAPLGLLSARSLRRCGAL